MSRPVTYTTTTGPRGGKKFINSKGHEEYGTPPKAAPKATKPVAAKPTPRPTAPKPVEPPVRAMDQGGIPLHNHGGTSHVIQSRTLGRVEVTAHPHAAHWVHSLEEAGRLSGFDKLVHAFPTVFRVMPVGRGASGAVTPHYAHEGDGHLEVRVDAEGISQRHAADPPRTHAKLDGQSWNVPAPRLDGRDHVTPHERVVRTAVHEMAHVVDSHGLDMPGPIREATIALRGLAAKKGIKHGVKADGVVTVSGYAKSSPAEFVAEAHTAYALHGADMQRLDPEAHAAVRRVRKAWGIE